MAASCGLDNDFTVIVWDLKDKLDAIGTATAANKTKV